MRKMLCVIGVVVVGGLGLAAPVWGHQGHASCAEGAQSFTVPLAQSGEAGEVISEEGKAGTAAETGAALHAAGCEPK